MFIRRLMVLLEVFASISYSFSENARTKTIRATPGDEGYAVAMPQSLNVSTGSMAEFSCKVFNFTADFVNWNLNGTRIQNYYPEVYVEVRLHNLYSNPVVSELKIKVTTISMEILNDGQISCEGLDLSENIYTTLESATSILRVQGPLSAPMNLTALFIHESLFLQWIPPFTLLGVNILGYLIETGSVNSSVHKQFSISGSQNSFDLKNETNCVEYKICLSAETTAGVGEQACTLRTRIAGVLGSLDDHRVEVMVLNHGNKSLLEDDYTSTCSEDQELDKIVLPKLLEEAEVNLTTNSSIQALHHNDSFIKFNLSVPFTTDDSVVFTNISLHEISNHVEDVLITNSDSGSMVECVFAQYSSTTSCQLTITCDNQTENLATDCEVQLMKGKSSLLPPCQLNCSMFIVAAFDIIANVTNEVPSVVRNNISLTFTSVQPTEAHSVSETSVTSFKPMLSVTASDTVQTSKDLVFILAIFFFSLGGILHWMLYCFCLCYCLRYCLKGRGRISSEKPFPILDISESPQSRRCSSRPKTSNFIVEVDRLDELEGIVELTGGCSESLQPQRYYPKTRTSLKPMDEVGNLDLHTEIVVLRGETML